MKNLFRKLIILSCLSTVFGVVLPDQMNSGASPMGDGSTSSPRARLLKGARPAVPAIALQERRLEPVEGCECQKRSAKPKATQLEDDSGCKIAFVDDQPADLDGNNSKSDEATYNLYISSKLFSFQG